MKKRIHLLEDFRETLHRRIPSRPELVRQISEILNIEKEPASRRLNGNVSFSVDEVGKLADHLNISLDSLLHENDVYKWTRYSLEKPWNMDSLEPLTKMIEQYLNKYDEIGVADSEFGFLYSTLPINLYMGYPYLSKFILFKWGYYYVGLDEFYNYESFEIPERYREIRQRFAQRSFDDGKIINIWDEALIWTLCREIQNFHAMHILDTKHMILIKEELHEMLSMLETFIRKEADNPKSNLDLTIYISNIHIGINSWYHISDKGSMSYLRSNFVRTSISENREASLAVRDWIISLRKISSLITGSGQKERRLFFEEQHKIIDLLLT